MKATVLQGDVFDVLPTLQPGSVDCVVTSPPYWRLRSYLAKDHPLKPLELGSEPTPQEYVVNQVRVLRLVRDALAGHGTVWLNVGDSYSNDPGNGRGNQPERATLQNGGGNPHRSGANKTRSGVGAGNLCLIPWRLAIALQDDGWLVRSVVVWHKPAPMCSSLTGWEWRRCRVKVASKDTTHMRDGRGPNGSAMRPHSGMLMKTATQWADCPGCPKCEPNGGLRLRRGSWRPTSSWEPILMLAKSPDYYADGESTKTAAAAATINRDKYTRILDDPDEVFAVSHDHETQTDTANLRDVWTIPAEPLREKHYAAFPTRLVHLCVKASTSAKGYCVACGKPWARVVERTSAKIDKTSRAAEYGPRTNCSGTQQESARVKTVGWRASCDCPAHEPRAGRVLDPFCGSGRTGIEANRLGLDFVGIELNPEYAIMTRGILREQSPLFAGLQSCPDAEGSRP